MVRLLYDRLQFVCAVVCLFALTGCAVRTPSATRMLAADGAPVSAPVPVVEPEPKPGSSNGDGAENAKVLKPGDELRVEVFREKEFSGSFRLNSDGAIRHPMLGEVVLGGLSVRDAELRLRTLLAQQFLVDPRVLVQLERSSSMQMQILLIGQVRNPGILQFPLGERVTLLEALARAGGFTEKASPNRVRVVRTVDGRPVTLRVRVAHVLAGRRGHRDIELVADDVITVPEVWF